MNPLSWLAPLALLCFVGCAAPVQSPPDEALAKPGSTVDASQPLSVLTEAAGSLDVSARARALDLLIRYDAVPGGGSWGPRALYDPHPYVQGLAVNALASRIREPESADLLAQMARREEVDPYVRGAAAFELALVGHTAILPDLQASMGGLPYWQRAPLALAAAKMGDTSALADLQASLARGEFPLELEFFEDLGRSGLSELAPSLTEAAGRVEEELILPIGMALMQLGSARGETIFREALSSSELELQLEALDYLADASPKEARALVVRARSQGPDAVEQYARLILFSQGEEGLDVAWEALASEDRESRLLAVQALGRYLASRGPQETWRRSERQVVAALVAALDDSEPSVVLATLQSLSGASTPVDQTVLGPLLHQDVLALRVEAAAVLLARAPRPS